MNVVAVLLFLLFVELIVETGVQIESYIVQGVSFKNIFIYGLSVLLFLRIFKSSRIYKDNAIKSINTIFLIFCLYSALTLLIPVFLSIDTFEYKAAFISYKNELFDCLLSFLIYAGLLTDEKNLNKIMRAFAFVIGIAAFLTALDAMVGSISIFGFDETEKFRPRGAFGEPNQTATILAMYMPFLLALSFVGGYLRLVYGACIVIVLMAIILTSSRGGLLGAAIGVFMFILLARRRIPTGNKIALIASVPVIFVIAWLILPEFYKDLLLQRFSFVGEKNVDIRAASSGRTYLWELATDMWFSSPVFGSGWSAFQNLNKLATHNVYIEYLVSVGIIGLSIYLLLWYKMFAYIYNARHFCKTKSEFMLICGFAAAVPAILSGIFFVNLYKPWLFVWSFMGIAIAYSRYLKRRARIQSTGLKAAQ